MNIKRPYLEDGRLSDIIALIQVLALDKRGHRGENGLNEELNGKPKSAESWTDIAIAHPEFFRADQTIEYGVSLIARHVIDRNEKGVRDVPLELIKKLIEIAIELHDRQKERADRWKVWLPVIVVIVAGLINVLVTLSTSNKETTNDNRSKVETDN